MNEVNNNESAGCCSAGINMQVYGESILFKLTVLRVCGARCCMLTHSLLVFRLGYVPTSDSHVGRWRATVGPREQHRRHRLQFHSGLM